MLKKEAAPLLDEENKSAQPIQISSQNARYFLIALLQFHPDKSVDDTTELKVTLKNGQPCLLLNDDPTSFQKCLVALQR